MKLKLALLATFGILFAALWHLSTVTTASPSHPAGTPPAPHQNLPSPPVSFTTITGQTTSLHTLPEPTIILNFWATWCPPCLQEMPTLLQAVTQAKGQIALVAISIDDKPEAISKTLNTFFPKALNQPHTYWVHDATKSISLQQFQVMHTPETILLNRQRQMAHKVVGPTDWLQGEGARLLKQTMAE